MVTFQAGCASNKMDPLHNYGSQDSCTFHPVYVRGLSILNRVKNLTLVMWFHFSQMRFTLQQWYPIKMKSFRRVVNQDMGRSDSLSIQLLSPPKAFFP